MSEYQYYEFVAIDSALTTAEQAEVRQLSTRARITATSFTNEYHWGDFRGDPRQLMERYYDAHLYLANWGTRHIMLRLPRSLLDPKVAERYCVDPYVSMLATRTHVILSLTSEDESGDSGSCPYPNEMRTRNRRPGAVSRAFPMPETSGNKRSEHTRRSSRRGWSNS